MDEKKVREAIKALKITIDIGKQKIEYNKTFEPKNDNEPIEKSIEHAKTAIEALEKQLPKKPICVPKRYTEELGFNDEFLCPVCKSYVGYFTEGMSEPEQMEYCNDCGQHIAKDWSE